MKELQSFPSMNEALRMPVLMTLMAVLASFAACDSGRYFLGRIHENGGRALKAVEAYEIFAEKRSRDPRACDALVRAARIYATRLERCLEARRLYEKAVRGYPDQAACVETAKTGVMTCPDYFPLDSGRSWIYGDTASGGKNMRLEWTLRVAQTSLKGTISTVLYAGKRKINEGAASYERKDWAIWKTSGTDRSPILRYPFTAGARWDGMRGEWEIEFKIMAADEKVETVAGTFTRCLKVREFDPRFPESWKYQYYAPFVGLVKTTIAGPGFENPNTELIQYDVETGPRASGGD